MFRAPRQTPHICTLLDDLLTRDLGQVARHLGIARSTLARYRRTGNAPRVIHLALFWETRWGASVLYCDLVNEHQVQRGLIQALERENATLRDQVLELELEVRTGGAANASFYLPGWSSSACERTPEARRDGRPRFSGRSRNPWCFG